MAMQKKKRKINTGSEKTVGADHELPKDQKITEGSEKPGILVAA